MVMLARPPGGNADRPRVKGGADGIATLHALPAIVAPLPMHNVADRTCHKEDVQPGWWTSRIKKGLDDNLAKQHNIHHTPRCCYKSKMKFVEYPEIKRQHSSESSAVSRGISNINEKSMQAKVPLTKMHYGAPHFVDGNPRNVGPPPYVPSLLPQLMNEKLSRDEVIPSKLKGNEKLREDIKFQQKSRQKLGYLSSAMSSGLKPLAKNLGFRPQSAYRGLRQMLPDNLDVETTETSKTTDGLVLDNDGHLNIAPVGPSTFTFILSSDAGSHEGLWWSKPYYLKYVSSRNLSILPLHLMGSGLWDRVVTMLCNLSFLVEKMLICGYVAVLTDLEWAFEGLQSRCAMFSHVESWQYTHQRWFLQVQQYQAFFKDHANELMCDPAAAYMLALESCPYHFCTQDAEHALFHLTETVNIVVPVSKITNQHQALEYSQCREQLTTCARHGVDRCWKGSQDLTSIVHDVASALQDWEIRVPKDTFGFPHLLPNGQLHIRSNLLVKSECKNEPRWFHGQRQGILCSIQLLHWMKASYFSHFLINSEPKELYTARSADRPSVKLFVCSDEKLSRERRIVLDLVLPSLRIWCREQGIELSWIESCTSECYRRRMFRDNMLLHSLNSIERCKFSNGPNFMLCLKGRNSSQKETSRQVHAEGSTNRVQVSSLSPSALKSLKHLKMNLQDRFLTVFDAWSYFDEEGDRNVKLERFRTALTYLKIQSLDPNRLFNTLSEEKSGQCVLDPAKFIEFLAWHSTSKDGTGAFMNKSLNHSMLCRRQIVKALKERMSLLSHGEDLKHCQSKSISHQSSNSSLTKEANDLQENIQSDECNHTPATRLIQEVSRFEAFSWLQNGEYQSYSFSDIEIEHGFVKQPGSDAIFFVEMSAKDLSEGIDVISCLPRNARERAKRECNCHPYCIEIDGWEKFAVEVFETVSKQILRKANQNTHHQSNTLVKNQGLSWYNLPSVVTWVGIPQNTLHQSDTLVENQDLSWYNLPSVVTWVGIPQKILAYRANDSTERDKNNGNGVICIPRSLEYEESSHSNKLWTSLPSVVSWLQAKSVDPATLQLLKESMTKKWTSLPSVVSWSGIVKDLSQMQHEGQSGAFLAETGEQAGALTSTASISVAEKREEHQSICNAYLRDVSVFMDTSDISAALPNSVEDVYDYFLLPWLEWIHGRAIMEEAAAAFLQAPLGLTCDELRAVITPRLKKSLLHNIYVIPLFARMYDIFYPLAMDGDGSCLTLRSTILKKVLIHRYKLHYLQQMEGHKRPTLDSTQTMPRKHAVDSGFESNDSDFKGCNFNALDKPVIRSEDDRRAVANAMQSAIRLKMEERQTSLLRSFAVVSGRL